MFLHVWNYMLYFATHAHTYWVKSILPYTTIKESGFILFGLLDTVLDTSQPLELIGLFGPSSLLLSVLELKKPLIRSIDPQNEGRFFHLLHLICFKHVRQWITETVRRW